MSGVVINGQSYVWESVTITLVHPETARLLQLLRKKKIDLIYGIGRLPVSVLFNDETEKLHPNTLEKIKNISRTEYFRFIDLNERRENESK